VAYYRPDGIEAFAASDGGVDLVLTRRGGTYTRHVGPDGFVSHIEAGLIVRPQVTRMAVYKWVISGKLKADIVNGVSMIRLPRLRAFAARHGYSLAD
jgi:hypothetical protein